MVSVLKARLGIDLQAVFHSPTNFIDTFLHQKPGQNYKDISLKVLLHGHEHSESIETDTFVALTYRAS